MDRYAVILAGGEGTRFWPLSRQQMPKQLLNISGKDIMINESINRLLNIMDVDNILVITNKNQDEAIKQLIRKELPDQNLLFEPIKKNTAACIAYAAMVIKARCDEAIMCVLPSDHYIADEELFRQTLMKAFSISEKTGKLVTIGIKPTFPSTGYGYIQYDREGTENSEGFFEVESFHEKPDIDKARGYLESGNYLWNSGIFIWRLSTILDNIERYLPRLYKTMKGIEKYIGTEKEQEVVDLVYSKLQSISIDYGILERSDEVLVVPGEFGWNDVGSWDILGAIFTTDDNGNIIRAKHIGSNTKNSIIYSNNRLIATIGVESLIIADTDDALLICARDKAQEVKKIVEHLKREGMVEYI